MSPAYPHLLLNHLPVDGVLVATILLAVALRLGGCLDLGSTRGNLFVEDIRGFWLGQIAASHYARVGQCLLEGWACVQFFSGFGGGLLSARSFGSGAPPCACSRSSLSRL